MWDGLTQSPIITSFSCSPVPAPVRSAIWQQRCPPPPPPAPPPPRLAPGRRPVRRFCPRRAGSSATPVPQSWKTVRSRRAEVSDRSAGEAGRRHHGPRSGAVRSAGPSLGLTAPPVPGHSDGDCLHTVTPPCLPTCRHTSGWDHTPLYCRISPAPHSTERWPATGAWSSSQCLNLRHSILTQMSQFS